MSDTPRTDRCGWKVSRQPDIVVGIDFARQLERELNAANDRIRSLIAERDTARMEADQKWNLRRDIAEELGGEDPCAALMKIRELKARVRERELTAAQARVRELEEWIRGLQLIAQRWEEPQHCDYRGPVKPEGLR